MRKTLALLLCSIAGFLSSESHAQDYPARPVRLVVPYAAGGNADIWARILGQKLSEAFGQAFVVENKPGAPEELSALIKRELQDYARLIKDAKVPAQ